MQTSIDSILDIVNHVGTPGTGDIKLLAEFTYRAKLQVIKVISTHFPFLSFGVASALALRYKYVHLYSGADSVFDEENVFKLTIPLDDNYSPEQGKGSQKGSRKSSQKIIELLRSNPQITIRKAAEQGDTNAQFGLGNCYYFGTEVVQNYTEAVKWYKEAAKQGDAAAQFALGLCYYYGQGVIKDRKEAIKWYRKSAKQGYQSAITILNKLRITP